DGVISIARSPTLIAPSDWGSRTPTRITSAAWYGYEKKRYDRAIADFNQALKVDPNLVSALVNRGIAWRSKAISTAPLPISTWRSGSAPRWRQPTTTVNGRGPRSAPPRHRAFDPVNGFERVCLSGDRWGRLRRVPPAACPFRKSYPDNSDGAGHENRAPA